MKLITIIIAALNEGDEPLKTIQSIYETANPDQFRIILFNDGSEPDKWMDIPDKYTVDVVTHRLRKGIQYCLDKGVEMSDTPYVAIFNSRMRFKKSWLDTMLKHLSYPLNYDTVFCTTTNSLTEEGEFTKTKRYGAEIHEQENGFLEPVWKKAGKSKVYDIPCVLGANYFLHRKWYTHIHGLNGQEMYGGLCVYLSLKTWAFGGSIKLVKDIEIGNIYRTEKPYDDNQEYLYWNRLITAFLLLPFDKAETMLHNLKESNYYDIIKNRIIHNMEWIVKERSFIKKNTIKDINHLINKNHGSNKGN